MDATRDDDALFSPAILERGIRLLKAQADAHRDRARAYANGAASSVSDDMRRMKERWAVESREIAEFFDDLASHLTELIASRTQLVEANDRAAEYERERNEAGATLAWIYEKAKDVHCADDARVFVSRILAARTPGGRTDG